MSTLALGPHLKSLLGTRTVVAVSESVGVSAATLYAWFQDNYPPDEVNLRRFLLAVELPPEDATTWGVWTATMQARAAAREDRPPVRRRSVTQTQEAA